MADNKNMNDKALESMLEALFMCGAVAGMVASNEDSAKKEDKNETPEPSAKNDADWLFKHISECLDDGETNEIRSMDKIRNAAVDLASVIDKECKNGREKSLAMTKLDECVMWANASIAMGCDCGDSNE